MRVCFGLAAGKTWFVCALGMGGNLITGFKRNLTVERMRFVCALALGVECSCTVAGSVLVRACAALVSSGVGVA